MQNSQQRRWWYSNSLPAAWVRSIVLGLSVGLAFFLGAHLGLALLTQPDGVAVFWPASGIAAGSLIALGPGARWPGAIGIMGATVAANLMGDRNLAATAVFSLCNAGEAILIAGLVAHHFGPKFSLDRVGNVLGLLATTAVGAAVSGVGGTLGFMLFHNSGTPFLTTWWNWFASAALGVIAVAPLLIGLGGSHARPTKFEAAEGLLLLAVIVLISTVSFAWPGSHHSFPILPSALVVPLVLCLAARCRPLFAAAAACIIALAIVCIVTFEIGRFGDPAIPLVNRVDAAQAALLALCGCILILSSLFAERRHHVHSLESSNRRLQLALDSAGLGTWSLDLKSQHFENDERDRHIHGYGPQAPQLTLAQMRGQVHPDDLAHLDIAFAGLTRAGGQCRAEYRLKVRPEQTGAGRERWIALEGAVVRDATNQAVQLLGVTRDITERKQAEQMLAERNAQLALAGKFALIGTFTLDVSVERMHVSAGYAAIHGLSEGTTDISRDAWRAGVHPEDLPQVEADFKHAMATRKREHYCEYRIVRAGNAIRWIDSRSLISYDDQGAAWIVGANIDVTQRKISDRALDEGNLHLALAAKAGLVGSFTADVETGKMRISTGYAAIHGFPEETTDITRCDWLRGVHPDDRARLKELRRQAFSKQIHDYRADYRIMRPGGEVRWIDARIFVSYSVEGHPQRTMGVDIDITERKQAELTLAERNMQLALAGKAGRVASFAYDVKTGRVQISEGYAAIYGFPEGTTEIARSQWRALLLPDDLERLESIREQAFADRQHEYGLEYRIILPDRGMRWIETRSFIEYDQGHPKRVVGVNIDVTERKRSEEAQKILNAELDHRVKNALATVSAVVSHTGQGSRSVTDFVGALEGRLRSMATTHELLSGSQWQGVSLTELVQREVAPYSTHTNININGPAILLKPEAGQAMAMVLHELSTNAAKYGAFSTQDGRVSIRWDRWQNGRLLPDLVLEWREIGGPLVAPGPSSYGTTTIRDLIPYEFGGTVDLELAREGVRCRLELPANWLSDTSANIPEQGLTVKCRCAI
jgi:PAS domain S-box-containing protein